MFYFLSEMFEQDLSLFMGSLDINLSFEIIPFEETINICADKLYNDDENPPNLPKHDFRDLLNIATK